MSERDGADVQTVFYLGATTALMDAVVAHTRGQLAVRGFRTLAGLMLASASEVPRTLVVEAAALPPGRDLDYLIARLGDATGVRPDAVYLADRIDADQFAVLKAQARVTFQPPFDGAVIASALAALASHAPPVARRVLMLGDSPLQDQVMATVLRRAGVRVDLVTAETLLQPAMARSRPDLVVVDLDMDLPSGHDISLKIRDCPGCEGMPIVFLSSDLTDGHEIEAKRIAGDDYLLKPVSAATLLARSDKRLARRTAMAAVEPINGPGPIPINRVHFMQRLDKEVAAPGVPGPGQAILYVQVAPQDQMPSEAPDAEAALRRQMATQVISVAAPGDRVTWITDGALALWVERPDLSSVEFLATRIARGGAPERPGDPGVPVSVGVGPFLPQVDTAQTLISRARAAWVDACAVVGDRVSVYRFLLSGDGPAASRSTHSARVPVLDPVDAALLPLLQQAVAGDGFQLVYQPILPLRKATHHRYEVLLRLHTPHGAIIPPLAFLPVAERHGLLPALDRWVLSGALEVLRNERNAGRPTRFLIHQTSASMDDPDWLPWVRSEILRLDLIRQRPVFEFSAESLIDNEHLARLLIPELTRIGIEVCLAGADDSERVLELIARRRIDCVKLKPELVAWGNDGRLKAMIAASHQRGARVIAAGIETPETIGRVWSSGVDYIQGNLIQFPEDSLGFNFEDSVMV